MGRVDKTPKFGDNAPIIVFDDADIEMAVKGAIASKYRNAGQTILVQDGVYDAFAKRLAEVIGSKGSRSS